MENTKHIVFKSIILLIFITLPISVSSYSQNTTHPALAKESANFFNQHYPDFALDDSEINLIMEGSINEDKGTRPMRHFYDPVYERGLVFPLPWQSSKKWAMDTKNQAGFLKKGIAGTIHTLFSSDSDYSWERAIYDYVWEDKKRGLKGLGHILHLIHDATVPDHTRNDPHPPAFEWGSPYESWTKQFGPENIDIVSKLSDEYPTELNSLEEYFNKVANYSNNNFFSKDTINLRDYLNPTLVRSGNYIINKELENKKEIAFILREKSFDTNLKIKEVYVLNDPENLILNNYWSLLSEQAVLNGAGVIKLFFDEVEKERLTKHLYKKNRNWFKRFYDNIEGKIFGLSKSFYGSSVDYENDLENPIERVSSNQSASVILTDQDNETDNYQAEITELSEPTIQFQDSSPEGVSEDLVDENEAPEVFSLVEEISENNSERNEEHIDEESNNDLPEWQRDFNNIPGYVPGFGGGGGGSKPPTPLESEKPLVIIESPFILKPASFETEFSTTTITFSGTASESQVISQDFSSSTATVLEDSSWSLTLSNFSEGTTTINFYTALADGSLISSSTQVEIGIDTTAPVFSSFTILECQYSLRADACLSASETINLSWSSSSTDIVSFEIYKDSILQKTTTATSTILSVSNGESTSVEILAIDDAGNSATSTAQAIEVSLMPVVINEIAWAGTKASASDEWIELYNRTPNAVDLSNVWLVARDGAPFLSLSGVIGAQSYYLIERTDDDTTDITADLVTAFSGLSGGSGLSNSGENLSLIQSLGGKASTTIDSTPSLDSCGGAWCAGTTGANPRTMERVNHGLPGTLTSNWKSNNTYTKNGADKDGNNLNGTPKSQNSVSLLNIGYYCSPESSSIIAGSYYKPTTTSCFYLSSAISGKRYGAVYLGEVASSIPINSHFLGLSINKNEIDDFSSLSEGDDVFIAIFKVRSGPAHDDLSDFHNFFKTGSSSPPHLEYGVLEWKYGTPP